MFWPKCIKIFYGYKRRRRDNAGAFLDAGVPSLNTMECQNSNLA